MINFINHSGTAMLIAKEQLEAIMSALKTLKFAIKLNKRKPSRINVMESESGKLIGSFSETLEAPDAFSAWDTLSTQQKYELSLYFHNLQYCREVLKRPTSELMNFRLFIPDTLNDALEKLYAKSQAQSLPFEPIEAMLAGLINYCRSTEQKLQKKDPKFSILSTIGIKSESKQASIKRENAEVIKTIFFALAKTHDRHDKFLKYAAYFNKTESFSDKTVALVAAGKSKISLWAISCALMVLGNEKHPVITNLSIDQLISLWLPPLLKQGNYKEEKKIMAIFNTTFPKIKATKSTASKIAKMMGLTT